MKHILPTIITLAFLSACTFISAEEKGLQLTMDSTAYNVNSLGLLRIENFTDRPVYLKSCSIVFPLYSVQKLQDDGRYKDVYTIDCSLIPPAPKIVEVESAIQSQIRVRFDVGRGELTSGTYRIRLRLHHDPLAATAALEEERSVTKPFFVR